MVVLSGADAIVETLIKNDIKYYFGVSASEFLEVTDSIYKRPNEISFMSGRYEGNAAMMANGYARVTGKPAPVIGTNGPGVAHMYMATGAARHHGIPLILLVPGFSRAELQDVFDMKTMDQSACFKPITKAQFDVDTVQAIPETIKNAIKIATTGRMGPVIVSVVTDLYTEKADVTIPPKAQGEPMHYNAESVRAAAKILVNAKRPVILYGERIHRYDLYGEAKELAETLAMPCISEYRASRGIVPEDTVFGFTGHLGGFRPYAHTLEAFSKADAVLALCCEFDNITTGKRVAGSPADKQIAMETRKIIQVDADPWEMSRRYSAAIEVLGNPKAVLARLVAEVKQLGMDRSLREDRTAEAKKLKDTYNNAVEKAFNEAKNKTPIQYIVVYKALQELLEKDAIQTHCGGNTNSGTVIQQARSPNSIHTDGVWHGLGQMFSMSLGMQIAYPDRQVVNVIGDGAFYFCNVPTEMETQKRLNLPVVTIVLNNGIYGNMRMTQIRRYGSRFIGTDFENPNFAEMGNVFKFHTERVEAPEEVKPAIKRALDAKRPALVDVYTPETVVGVML